MITGVVNADYEAVIRLSVRGATGRAIDAIIDTGFNGFLTLPPPLVTALGLTRLSRGRAVLANGSEQLYAPHAHRRRHAEHAFELPVISLDTGEGIATSGWTTRR